MAFHAQFALLDLDGLISYGGRKLKGHVMFLDRTNSVLQVAEALSQLHIKCLIFEQEKVAGDATAEDAPKFQQFRIRRSKVSAFLDWAYANSLAYQNIPFSLKNLNQLPEDGFINSEAVTVLDGEDNEDLGLAPSQRMQEGDLDVEITESGIVESSSAGAFRLRQRIDGMMQHLQEIASDAPAYKPPDPMYEPPDPMHESLELMHEPQGKNPVLVQHGRTTDLVDWKTFPYFWGAAYPTVFMPYGSYASHPTLKFALYNIKQSEQTMNSTSFGISQMIAEEPLNLGQIWAILMEERDGRSLVNNVETLPNPTRGQGATAENAFIQSAANKIISMVEHHWPEVFQVIEDLFSKWGLAELADAVQPASLGQGASTEQINHVLIRYRTIVNQVFVLGTNSWFKIVLTEGIGIGKFAKS
ncbi:hypothetical protein BJ741DRAFT_583805 [Chytriomyces cf. hyalinus JEL632]|nr:hypothetical protein BJ741DRAFT_583805 [Chytriomyces cf. hyalinus JEL632]